MSSNKKRRYSDNFEFKKRVLIGLVGIFIVFILLSFRLSYVMVGKSEEYKDLATNQWTNIIKLDPKRGNIVDRNGNALAISVDVYKIYIDLKTLKNDLKRLNMTERELAGDIAPILDMDEEDVYKKLTKTWPDGTPYGGIDLIRQIELETKDEFYKKIVKEKGFIAFVISDDTKRYYTNNSLASHVIGHTRADGVGLTGVELMYDRYLTGLPGYKMTEVDATRKIDLPYSIADYTKPVPGRNVVLTIDSAIQLALENAAEQALKDNSAKAVTIVAMDPNTGEILGLTNKPDYNLNDPWVTGNFEEDQKLWRNRSVSDTFEPGSIFKVVTATAAISENKVVPGETFVCNGSLKVGGRTIHCHKRTGHGAQTFEQIVQNSCNVGFMILGSRLGPELMNKYISAFGLGQKTGIDLNGEAAGIVKETSKITESDLATISFGQTNTLTIAQYMSALNAIANGGKLITPHVMKEIYHYDDENNKIVDKTYEPKVEQVISPEVATQMRAILETVVSEGGGKKAYIPGYRIGGKTGTAQKINTDRPGYASGKYIASFVGMAPSDNPKITIMVSIDEPDPSNYYGGQIAAPVGQQVFNDIFNYLALQPNASEDEINNSFLKDVIVPEVRGLDKTDAIKMLRESSLSYKIEGDGKYISDMNPKPGYTTKEGSEIILHTSNEESYGKNVLMPDLKGMDMERANKLLDNLGLSAEFIGEGIVSDQVPKSGVSVEKGTVITIYLEHITD